MNYEIISDGACDLLDEYVQKHHIYKVPFYVTFDGQNYSKEGIGITHDTFYEKMIQEHAVPKSSLPSIGDYLEVFEPIVQNNTPIICITITSKFSGSYNSAKTAAEQLLEQYPAAQITIIDSTLNTMSQALFVNEAVRMRDNGISYHDAIENLERIKDTGRIYFTIGSMEYLVKNGRIGKLAVLAGDKLGIRPTIVMQHGDITLGGISRSRKKSILSVLDCLKKYIEKEQIDIHDYSFLAGYGYGKDEYEAFKELLFEKLSIKSDDSIQSRIGTTIGCHTGPYPLGVALLKKYDA